MQGKKVSESRVTIQNQVLPHHTNASGKMHGGELLRMLDSAGAICAFRHARGALVTAAIAHMEFIAPVHPGDIIMFHCSVNTVARTSMEVGVRIEAESYTTGKVRHVSTGYLIFVGTDAQGQPRTLPPLIAETEEEKRRMADGTRRMAISRLTRRTAGSFTQYFRLKELPGLFSLYQVSPHSPLPQVPAEDLLGIVRTREGIFCAVNEACSLAFAEEPALTLRDYFCLAINESMTQSSMDNPNALQEYEGVRPGSVGVLASITSVLAAARIPVLILSTLTNSLMLLPIAQRHHAFTSLEAVGHRIEKTEDDPCQ